MDLEFLQRDFLWNMGALVLLSFFFFFFSSLTVEAFAEMEAESFGLFASTYHRG